MNNTDVIIIGSGASGLMCAIEAGKRNRNVIILDHANKVGKKILMSGGGRCNFTNYTVSPEKYLSHNPHFCKSALSRYNSSDFIDLVKKYNISFHEKEDGQLFCDNRAHNIVDMLLAECKKNNVKINLNTTIEKIEVIHGSDIDFKVKTDINDFFCKSLVIATGGLSIPTIGATAFGHKVAEIFNIKTNPTRPGLVPLTISGKEKERISSLAGVSVLSKVSCNKKSFSGNLLFTHRGLSGPVILQISSYWDLGQPLRIDLLPNINLLEQFQSIKKSQPQFLLKMLLAKFLAKRVVSSFVDIKILELPLQAISNKKMLDIEHGLHNWQIIPSGTEGYRSAEVTLGGVDCNEISSKTMEAKKVQGLYFIGEVLDVTGWLGGYNLQWAWSSGWAAGQIV